MTNDFYPETVASDRVENDVIADLALRTAEAQELDPRGLYLAVTADGGRELIDITQHVHALNTLRPLRKTGRYGVTDVDDFLEYLAKHAGDDAELWGNDKAGTIRAVVDAHEVDLPGHEQHTVTLTLPHTADWTAWVARDGKLDTRNQFAEFIEDHLPNFVMPTGADMLELAQTFQATTKVDFASSQRIKSGETQLQYTENTTAGGGRRGQLGIPDTFEIALQVHERGPVYRVAARFRYRISGGTLLLGYRLACIDDVRRAAFDEVVAKVEDTNREVWHTP